MKKHLFKLKIIALVLFASNYGHFKGQTTKVKGMFVHPEQVNAVVKRHSEIQYARLNVDHDANHNDVMTLECEMSTDSAEVNTAIVSTLRDLTKLRGEVVSVPTNSLARDGKVIDDRRKYD